MLASVPLADGRVLIAAYGNGRTGLWDSGHLVGELPVDSYSPPTLTPLKLPTGQVLLVVAGHDEVKLWDPMTCQPVGDPLGGHVGWVLAVAPISLPNGRVLLATGGEDATVRIWDPLTSTEITRLVVGAPVHDLLVCPGTPGLLAYTGPAGIAAVDLVPE
jgi:WD40 repeat protein